VPKKQFSRAEIEQKANLNVPTELKQKYVDILYKHQAAISISKMDLGRAKNFTHKIHLKDNNPVYRKQFKIPEAHQNFIEATLDEWLKLGVVKRSNSLYNSPLFCVPKKQGQGLRIVQDFRELNNHSHIDKYSMKEITECIGDIGRANSTIFSTLDLTSGFWQMQLDEDSQPLTAFTIPGKGQYHWVTSPMGLLGCPASFQRLMETVLRNINNVLVYIDDVLLHTATHEEHLQVLEKVFERLHQNHLKVNLDKCVFGNKEVSYLGFMLTPEGIKPGRNKLQAIRDAQPPTNIKMVRSFVGLCNFFRTHIKDFAIIAAPLFKVTRKDSGYKSGPLPPDALHAFKVLQQQLTSDPVMAFPRSDRQYALITDAATGSADFTGGLGAILTQIDQHGNHYAISFASRQLKDHEKNYSPFLLEAAAAVWGMEIFNEYLRGKQFILFTDHKPLEKLGHLHTKTLNRLQTALLEHDFVVQYKKGTTMPADYLSRLPSLPISTIEQPQIAAFDPFTPDLQLLQRQDQDLQAIFHFLKNNEWPATLTKQAIRNLAMLAPKVFFDKNKLAWIRLEDHNYPRTALWLPERYRKEALCETHDSIFAGHNAALKSYLKLTTSYFWPTVYSHVLKHTQTCLRCQQRKTGKKKNQPLAPLPIPDTPNTRIHADLFGPMVDASRKSAYILCITDAFTKYAVVTTIQNKDAQTVAKAIFEQWFCKFGIPAQIHTDGGKEFVNKLLGELCELLNVQHTKTTPYHPQCNSQVEVFNKTVKKYLASYVDETTLNWDEFLPALMLAYNTSYHSTIATTPFELLFGIRPRLPSLPAPEIQQHHYGESFPAERLQLLQHARQVARKNAEQQGLKYKLSFDQSAAPHKFKIEQKVWLSDTTALGKNPKLTPKWVGPYKIVDLNDNNAKIELKPHKFKVVNISRLKAFEENKNVCPEEPRFSESAPSLSQDTNIDQPQRPLTRALKRLIDFKNAATMAISFLNEDFECPYTFTKNYTQYCCDKCYNAFKKMNFSTDPNVCEKHKNLIKSDQNEKARAKSLCALIKNIKYCKNDADQTKKDADPIKISTIKEELRGKLTSIASKLLSSQHSRFEHLSKEEQILWTSFDNGDIYEFITGEPDTLPEFQYNWIEPCQLAIHFPKEINCFPNQLFQLPADPIKAPVPVAAPPVAPAVAPQNLPAQHLHQDQEGPQVLQPQPDPQPVAGPSQPPQSRQHDLRPRPQLNYKELHTGIKQRCRKLRRQAKAVVTKLAPGSFSPNSQPPGPSSNPETSS
jgi:transposase InsO family protein